MGTDQRALQEWVTAAAERLAVPGVAVGVLHAGEEHYAFHGVTSIDNPLPVDEHTLFQFGSTGKTFTATAMMRLVEQGLVAGDDQGCAHVGTLPDRAARIEGVVRRLWTAARTGGLWTANGPGGTACPHTVES